MMAMAGKSPLQRSRNWSQKAPSTPMKSTRPGFSYSAFSKGATKNALSSAPFARVKPNQTPEPCWIKTESQSALRKKSETVVRQPRHRHPTLVANYIPDGMEVEFQSENGILGMGPFPLEGDEDADLINAESKPSRPCRAVYFDSATSFGMIRGQHVQLTVRRHGGGPKWGHRQLEDPGQNGQGHGRCDGPRRQCREHHRGHDAHEPRRTVEAFGGLLPPADRRRMRQAVVTNLAVLDIREGAFHLVERAPG